MSDIPENPDLRRFIEKMSEVDELSSIVLKGHLLMEEMVTRAIEFYFFHGELLDGARLSFSQKLILVQAASTDQHENSMWNLISAVNSLRNEMVHSLERPKLQPRLNDLRAKYFNECPEDAALQADEHLLRNVVLLCMGFLSGVEREIERFRWWVNQLDHLINKQESIENPNSHEDPKV